MSKYPEELTNYIIKEYLADPVRETLERLAEELGDGYTYRGLVNKLRIAEVYKAPVRLTKSGEALITKPDLAKEINEAFGLSLTSLVSMKKQDLRILSQALRNPDNLRAIITDLEYEDD